MLRSVSLRVVSLLLLLASASLAETGAAQVQAFLENYLRVRERMHSTYSGQAGQTGFEKRSSYNAELVGSYRPDSDDIFTNLYVSGDHVFLGNAFDGLRVIDVADPASPREIGSFPGHTTGVARLISGEILPIATTAQLLFPTAVAFARKHDSLFLADFGSEEGKGALLRIDVVTGEMETLIDGDPLIHPLDIAIDTSGALIVTTTSSTFGDGEGRILRVDPETGTATILMQDSSIPFPYGTAVDSSGAIFIANMFKFDFQAGEFEFGKLIRLDPATGETTTIVKADPESSSEFFFLGDLAFDGNGDIIAIDPGADPFFPPKILRINPRTRKVTTLRSGPPLRTPMSLAVGADGSILIADSNADPRELGITTGAIFRLDPESGSLTTLATGAGVGSPFGLALDQDGELIWTHVDKPVRIADVKVLGDLAVVTNEPPPFPEVLNAGLGGIQILDISDPANPLELAKYTDDFPFGVHNSFIVGDLVYLVENSGGLRIVDIADPRAPFEIGHWEIPQSEQERFSFPSLHDLSVSGDRAYLAYAEAGLRILDVSDPRNPIQIGVYTYPGGWTHSAEPGANGDLVYLTDEQPGGFMRVIDVSDLANPREIAQYKSSSGPVEGDSEISIHNILVKGDLVYVANYQDGFRVVDVSDPTDPVEVGFYIISESYDGFFNGAWTSFPANGLVFVSDLTHGLFIFRFQRPAYLVREVGVRPPQFHLGIETDVILTAQVQAATGGGGAVSVTADLSPLGGSAAVPLFDDGQDGDEVAGDGIFARLLTLTPEGQTGEKELTIVVQDRDARQVSGRLIVPLFPTADRWMFRDGLEEGWQVESSSGVEADLMQSATVYEGEVAGAFHVDTEDAPRWTLNFLADAPVDTLGFSALRFAFHPGETEKRTVAIFGTRINGRASDLVRGEHKVDLDRRDWQVVELPLENSRGAIESIVFSGNLEGTFYLDEIRLVAASPPRITAVLGDRTDALPQGFRLEQNHPNPFNSSTTIRFELPSSTEIDLAVFNLAGQKVVTLAQGHREAGTYSLKWDGRDDDERELASGVYLYRLEADERVETRKLLLLR
jgi:sugar lactone lactonase YvrE